MSDKYRNFLLDFGTLVREQAFEATNATAKTDLFQEGRAFAYYEVISLLLHQAFVFEIPASDVGLSGVDPDRDLL
jgi:hypothetical protein